MIAEIVSVGTELLMGQVVNTDAQFIARHLAPLGYQAFYQVTVGDNPTRLTGAVREALARADVVLFTGGLGPTDDDLTKETVAAALNIPLDPVPEEEARLRAYFTSIGREMTPNNLKQARFPRGGIILPNPNGTAPGCIMEAGGKAAILLPGPPRELYPMFTNHVLPYLERRSGVRLYSRELRFFGMGESELTYRIRDIISAQTNPTVAPYVKTGEVTLRITAQCRDEVEGKRLVAPMIEEIARRLGPVLYSTDGEPLPALCVRLLCERGETLAVAESCTGGQLASAIVDVPGCSACFLEGDVTYANDAKVRRLGVSPQTLATQGAVSAACAREMAEGMRTAAGATYALATTGIAGPDGGTPDKPVGLVYAALSAAGCTQVAELRLSGDRARVRTLAVLHALDLLRRQLLGLPAAQSIVLETNECS